VLFHVVRRRPLLRLGIHPPDVEHAAIWNHILCLVQKFCKSHHPVTYLDWLLACREEPCGDLA
jgi:hypothetical protein